MHRIAEPRQQGQSPRPDARIRIINHHIGEEGIDRPAQTGQRRHCVGEALIGHGLLGGGQRGRQCGGEQRFRPIAFAAGRFADAVLLRRLQDIGRALVTGEQVGAVLGFHERLQRLHAGEQTDKIILAAEGEHGVDQIVANAGFALLDFQAVGEEVQQLGLPTSIGNRQSADIGEILHQLAEAQPRAGRLHDRDTAQGLPAKRKRVLRTGWRHVGLEEANQCIQLVGKCHCHTHRRNGHVVAQPCGLVVIADGVGDGWLDADGQGEIAANLALHFRELANRGGDEIGLGEARGPFGLRRIGRHYVVFA